MNTSDLKLHFNAPGFKSQEIEIAPVVDVSPSKRKPLIDQEDDLLDDNMKVLDLGTRARNRAFQERLDEIWRSTAAWEKDLQIEAKSSVETILNMKDDYQKHLDSFSASLLAEVNTIFNKFDTERLPAESSRLDETDKDLEVFFKQIVPSTIEKQSGEVSRQLRRAYETFDIEKKKEEKRESKLVKRAAKHFQKTSQRFEDEAGFLSSCFHNVESDVVASERIAARMHLIRNKSAFSAVTELLEIAKTEEGRREEEDVIVLDTVVETQHLLQETVLMHFGSKAEEALVFDKLDQRMAHIEEKKSKHGDKSDDDSHSVQTPI